MGVMMWGSIPVQTTTCPPVLNVMTLNPPTRMPYFILPSFQFCLVKGISSLRGQIFTNGWLDFPLSWNPSSSALLPEAALAIRFLGMFSGIFSACTTLGEHIAQSPHGKTPTDCTHDFALGFFCLQNFRFPTFYHH